jgi:hypothetical protein
MHANHSHQILTVIVDGVSHVTGSRSHGCLHLIDLAGSERVSKSEASGRAASSGAGTPHEAFPLFHACASYIPAAKLVTGISAPFNLP